MRKKKTQKERRAKRTLGRTSPVKCEYCHRDHPTTTCKRKLLGLPATAEVKDIMKALRAGRFEDRCKGQPRLHAEKHTGDYWVKKGNEWTRVHCEPRTVHGTPWLWQGGPVTAGYTLLPRRTAKKVYENSGVEETVEDEWDSHDPHQITEERWTGSTTFYVDTEVARKANPPANDVCYALLEGGATQRAKQDPEYSFWAN